MSPIFFYHFNLVLEGNGGLLLSWAAPYFLENFARVHFSCGDPLANWSLPFCVV